MNRRSLSEVSNAADETKPSSHRRSMIETDAQGNISLRSPINNVNLQVPSRTRYSYIGLTEPSSSPTEASRQSAVVRRKVVPVPPPPSDLVCAALATTSAHTPPSPVLSASTSPPTAEVAGLSLKRMWTCTKCSYAYNPLWSDRCDICNSVRSPPSVNEPSLITVTKDSVRYTPTKLDGEASAGNSDAKVPLPGTPATLAMEETDLEDDIEVTCNL